MQRLYHRQKCLSIGAVVFNVKELPSGSIYRQTRQTEYHRNDCISCVCRSIGCQNVNSANNRQRIKDNGQNQPYFFHAIHSFSIFSSCTIASLLRKVAFASANDGGSYYPINLVAIATKAFTIHHIALTGNNTATYFKQLI